MILFSLPILEVAFFEVIKSIKITLVYRKHNENFSNFFFCLLFYSSFTDFISLHKSFCTCAKVLFQINNSFLTFLKSPFSVKSNKNSVFLYLHWNSSFLDTKGHSILIFSLWFINNNRLFNKNSTFDFSCLPVKVKYSCERCLWK